MNSQKKFTMMIPLIMSSIILIMIVNLSVYPMKEIRIPIQTSNLYPSDNYNYTVSSYNIDPTGYFSITALDPQITFYGLNATINFVELRLASPAESEMQLQIYYSTEEVDFNESNSVILSIAAGETDFVYDISPITCKDIRFDIDGNFQLETLSVSNVTINHHLNLSINNLWLTIIIIIGIAVTFIIWQRTGDKKDKLTITELSYWLICSGYYFVWSCTKPYNFAPDEYMRYSVSKFMFDNNRLPVGIETATDNPWGYSYAHMPTMMCNFLGYIPMKIVSLFTDSEYALVVASRFGCMVCGSICVLFAIKIAKIMIPKPYNAIMVIFASMMPQFCFLSSYINNDICALCGAFIIMYAWVRIIEDNWSMPISVTLAVGIGICGVSYYNSYGWVLMSVIMLIYYMLINKDSRKYFLKQGLVISGIVLAIMAFPFIRQVLIYGDLLGFDTYSKYGEIYAIDSLKPSVRNLATLSAQGVPVKDMLFSMGWLSTTYKSFIAVFGYMQYPAHSVVFKFYFTIFCGMILILWHMFILNRKKITRNIIIAKYKYIFFYLCLIVAMIIPVMLSIIHSYTIGYQPQGRYIYSCFPGLALFFGLSYSWFFNRFEKKMFSKILNGILCISLIVVNVCTFILTYLPA